jgi:hypothetical protein
MPNRKLRNIPLEGPFHRKLATGSDINVTSGDVTSGHVTSGCSPLFPHKYDFVRTHILLMYLHLNNWEFCRVKSENFLLNSITFIMRPSIACKLFSMTLTYCWRPHCNLLLLYNLIVGLMYCFYVLLWTKNVY